MTHQQVEQAVAAVEAIVGEVEESVFKLHPELGRFHGRYLRVQRRVQLEAAAEQAGLVCRKRPGTNHTSHIGPMQSQINTTEDCQQTH